MTRLEIREVLDVAGRGAVLAGQLRSGRVGPGMKTQLLPELGQLTVRAVDIIDHDIHEGDWSFGITFREEPTAEALRAALRGLRVLELLPEATALSTDASGRLSLRLTDRVGWLGSLGYARWFCWRYGARIVDRVVSQEANLWRIERRGIELTLAWEDHPLHAFFLESGSEEGDRVVRELHAIRHPEELDDEASPVFGLDRRGRTLLRLTGVAAVGIASLALGWTLEGDLRWAILPGIAAVLLAGVALFTPNRILVREDEVLELLSLLGRSEVGIGQLRSLRRLDRGLALLTHAGGRILLTTHLVRFEELVREVERRHPDFLVR